MRSATPTRAVRSRSTWRSSSSTGIFSLHCSGGAPVTSVTIPSGQSTRDLLLRRHERRDPPSLRPPRPDHAVRTADRNGQSAGTGEQARHHDRLPPSIDHRRQHSSASASPSRTSSATPSPQETPASTDTIKLALSSGTFSTGRSTLTATAANGVVAFSNLAINTPGSYTITATDTRTPRSHRPPPRSPSRRRRRASWLSHRRSPATTRWAPPQRRTVRRSRCKTSSATPITNTGWPGRFGALEQLDRAPHSSHRPPEAPQLRPSPSRPVPLHRRASTTPTLGRLPDDHGVATVNGAST